MTVLFLLRTVIVQDQHTAHISARYGVGRNHDLVPLSLFSLRGESRDTTRE